MDGEEGQTRDLRIARLAEETRPPLPLPMRPGRTHADLVALLSILTAQVGVSFGCFFWFTSSWPRAMIALGVVMLIAVTAQIVAVRQRLRLVRLVKEHKGLVCPRCRYPLDTLPLAADRCPECATAADRLEIVRMWRRNYAISERDAPDPSALDART